MRYVWEHLDWPNFHWDTETVEPNAYAWARQAGVLLGEIKHLPETQKSDALIDLMVAEAMKTSQIEGENLDPGDVRSSIRNQLGMNVTQVPVRDLRANGIATMMLSVREHFAEPLTAERLCDWQNLVITEPRERTLAEAGRWRTNPVQIVSGGYGREVVHYEAPPANRVPNEMDAFMKWFNSSQNMRAVVRAGVAHLHFECIHPFGDGNGRVGRAVAEVALAQELGQPALLSLSTSIHAGRNEYYDALNRASQGGLDITEWLVWFSGIVLDAQQQAHDQIGFVVARALFWSRFESRLNERQSKVVSRMFREGLAGFEGGMNASKYAKLTGCAKATATRDLTLLLEMGAFRKLEGGGRSTRYDLKLEGN